MISPNTYFLAMKCCPKCAFSFDAHVSCFNLFSNVVSSTDIYRRLPLCTSAGSLHDPRCRPMGVSSRGADAKGICKSCFCCCSHWGGIHEQSQGFCPFSHYSVHTMALLKMSCLPGDTAKTLVQAVYSWNGKQANST